MRTTFFWFKTRPGLFFVTKLPEISEKIIPLFDKYPIQGTKALDYADFKRAANIIKVRYHLTE